MATITEPRVDDEVARAYDRLAPYYDAFTAGYDYATWTTALEALAAEHGLRGQRLLDVACGTGKSFLPFLDRGYDVTACDISSAMLAVARTKAGTRARLELADMRELPDLGSFDLITCLDDSLNYVLTDEALVSTFRGIARCLADDGLLVFDCNSRATYRTAFRMQFVRESDSLFSCWRGDAVPDGDLAAAQIDVFAREGRVWQRVTSKHVQRYHAPEVVAEALEDAGLELVARRGQSPGGRLDLEPNEDVHTKVVYLARREAP